ncbi:hypothetical protein EHS25_000425 [Saitozyma podzolica]|uniref:GPI-anchor transamidase n=1 Tax=Saitozyma podzolica TaxID=1890683 RepID=A0A427YW23_9TREE|nr:hypothetical protein EHS25_000425 [Saitozyma podzolica]
MLISLRAALLAAVALLAPFVVGQELPPQLTQQVADLFAGNGSVSSGATVAGIGATGGRHTNNWAVLVCASRYWFNYRHMANTLAMYRTIKRLGIPDSNIILMLADDVACNARNAFPATVYANAGRQMDLYGDGIEVDYRGYEVTVESFLRLLTGRHPDHLPPSKRLLTDASSNVFIYMTGHGGNEFLKFQDNEEVSAFDIADAIEQMWEKRSVRADVGIGVCFGTVCVGTVCVGAVCVALPALPVLPALPALPALPLLPALLDVAPVSMRGVASPDSYPHRPTPSVPLSHFAFRTPLAALMLYPHNADVPSRFNKLLYVVDTCQANTMFSKFYSPNIISTGSSSLGENSYSHHHDLDIGVAVIDSFTHYILEYLETLGKSSKATLKDFFNTYDPARIQSHPGISTELSHTPRRRFSSPTSSAEWPPPSQNVLAASQGSRAAVPFSEFVHPTS